MNQSTAAATNHSRGGGLYRLPPQLLWPGLVVVLLVGQIVVCFVMISRAVGDPTVAIEPNYYQKAVNWDADQAALAASARLGWTARWEVASSADVIGDRLVKLTLVDEHARPITDATVALCFFHHARAAHRIDAMLIHGGQGTYVAPLPMKQDGLWTFEAKVTKGENIFLHTTEIKLTTPSRATS